MKWELSDLIYATVGAVVVGGICFEVHLPMLGSAFGIVAIIICCIAFLRYLSPPH